MAIPEKHEIIDMELIARFISRHNVTMITCSPLLLNELNKLETTGKIHTFISGGDILKAGYIEALVKKGNVYNTYGPTETTVCVTYRKCPRFHSFSPDAGVSIGKPISNYRVYILDRTGGVTPMGVPGELCVAGAGVSRGYLNRPELTSRAFLKNPFGGGRLYRTGDLARWDPDGNILFLGRIDHQVKIRGYRIELGEIENRMKRYGRVDDAVVLTGEDESGDMYLSAYYISAGEIPVSELREHLSADLPDYMIPSYFTRVDTWPLTASGKLDRQALPDPSAKSGAAYAAPRNRIEERLAALWAEVLGSGDRKIGIDDNFFELGGHSLKATVLASKIHKEFHVAIPLSAIFNTPTLRGFAVNIGSTGEDRFTSIRPVEKKEYYPLSSAQGRLYVLQQLDPGNTAYNIPMIIRLAREHNIAKLENIFKRLITRHESLRTSFHLLEEHTVQKVHKDAEFNVEYFDAKGGDDDYKRIVHRFVRPFDLARAPLLRAGVIRGKDRGHLLMVDMHHIMSDEISHAILIRDFMAFYRDETLAPLRLQYKDFSEWQNSEGEQKRISDQGVYWFREFQGNIPLLNMPTDFKRSDKLGFEGSLVSFEIDGRLTAGMRKAASIHSVTPTMFLMAVYKTMLSKYTGQEEIVVGTVIAGRRHADLQDIFGFFVNMLAVKTMPRNDRTFADYLKEVKEKTVNAYENQDYPFEELVSKLGLPRVPGRHPLIDTVFVFQEAGGVEEDTARLFTEDPDLKPLEVSHFDLMFHAAAAGDSISVTVEYSTTLFKEKTIERISDFYLDILKQVLENETVKLGEITTGHEFAVVTSDVLLDGKHDFDF